MNLNGNGVAKMATKLDLDLDLDVVLNCADHKNSIKSNRMKSRRIADSNIIPSPHSPLSPLRHPALPLAYPFADFIRQTL